MGIIEQVYQSYENNADQWREHLGASQIGNPCLRAVWYGFRWATPRKFSGRLLRLFQTGHLAESRFVADLRSVGAEVYDCDQNGNQFNYSAHGGHFGASLDGVARNLPEQADSSEWVLLEFKTHSEKSFNELEKKKVQEAKPLHYAQMQVYMRLARLSSAFYMAVNKNTDQLYGEWVELDEAEADRLIEVAGRLIFSNHPPERISNDPAWYQCKLCPHHKVCHGFLLPPHHCRTCISSTPEENGTWSCSGRHLDKARQMNGCEWHRYLPPMVEPMAKPVDSKDRVITYETPGKGRFENGGDYGFSSEEMHLAALESGSLEAIGDAVFQGFRDEFDAKVTQPFEGEQTPVFHSEGQHNDS